MTILRGKVRRYTREQFRIEGLEQENQRLREFALQLAERLFLVAEILAIKAEQKDKRKMP